MNRNRNLLADAIVIVIGLGVIGIVAYTLMATPQKYYDVTAFSPSGTVIGYWECVTVDGVATYVDPRGRTICTGDAIVIVVERPRRLESTP